MKNQHSLPTPEDRHRMIAKSAYFRAERRGFTESDPIEDWLASEAEIEKSLKSLLEAEPHKQEHAAYQRMRLEMKKLLTNTQNTVNADTIKQAFEKVNRELRELGEFVPGTVDKASKRLKRELATTVERMGPRWEAFSEKSGELFEAWKDRGTNFLNQASKGLNDWVQSYRKKDE